MFKKLFLIFLGLIFAFVLLEGFLRGGSLLYLKFRIPEYTENRAYTILCIGDSFTIGLGARIGSDYPSQLGEILNFRNQSLNFRVINAGLGGATSSMVLNSLDNLIKEHKPSILVVMVGCNDGWNYTALNISSLPLDMVPLSVKIESALSSLRIYKLIKISYVNLKNKIKKDQEIYSNDHHTDKAIISNTQKLQNIFELAEEHYKKNNLIKAIGYYKKGLYVTPMNADAYNRLAFIYQQLGKFEQAISYCKRIIDMDSAASHLKHAAYLQLMCLTRGRKYDEEIELILEKNKTYGFVKRWLRTLYLRSKKHDSKRSEETFEENINYKDSRNEFFKDIISRIYKCNLEKIAMIAKDNDIKLIFCSYPNHTDLTLYMEDVSYRFGIIFVDLRPIFEKILKTENKEKYFVPDNHCNGNGYRVIAETIADLIYNKYFSNYSKDEI